MLDFSFGELLVVAFVAFMVVGPKEFPIIMRTVGRWLGHCKGLADEFRVGFNSAMKQHGMEDLETDLATIEEEARFIRDQNGNLQRIYNFSDYTTESKAKSQDDKPQMKAIKDSPSAQ